MIGTSIKIRWSFAALKDDGEEQATTKHRK